jgi:hypothetical protein
VEQSAVYPPGYQCLHLHPCLCPPVSTLTTLHILVPCAPSSQLKMYLKIARSQISKQQKINQGKPGFDNVKSYQLSHRQRISYCRRLASSTYANNTSLAASSTLSSSVQKHRHNQYAALAELRSLACLARNITIDHHFSSHITHPNLHISCRRNQSIACIATRSLTTSCQPYMLPSHFILFAIINLEFNAWHMSLKHLSKIILPSGISKHQTHSSPDLSRRQWRCLYRIHFFHFRITNIDLLYLAAFCRSWVTSCTPYNFADLSCICSHKLKSLACLW